MDVSRFIQTITIKPRRNQQPEKTQNEWGAWNSNKNPLAKKKKYLGPDGFASRI